MWFRLQRSPRKVREWESRELAKAGIAEQFLVGAETGEPSVA